MMEFSCKGTTKSPKNMKMNGENHLKGCFFYTISCILTLFSLFFQIPRVVLQNLLAQVMAVKMYIHLRRSNALVPQHLLDMICPNVISALPGSGP